MAWNDVKKSTNKAVHLLVSIAGHDFNFHQAVDIKVERKIGDTLSKFSLGIIDDSGSNQRSDYVEFERYIVRNFVDINISYGNSATDMQKFSGFVVDYQPVFFGSTTKLTVTGYITKINSTTVQKNISSPYSYWYDWTPYIGARVDEGQDWDDKIYGHYGFTWNDAMLTAAKNMGVDTSDISDKWAGTVVDEATMSTINSVLNAESRTFNQTKNQYENMITNWLTTGTTLNDYFIKNGINSKSSLESVNIGLEKNNPSTVTVTYKDYESGEIKTFTQDLSVFTTQAGMSALGYNSFTVSETAYRKKLNLLLSLAKQDALDAQDAQGNWKGVTPFRSEIMKAYTGNIKTQQLTNEHTGRSLDRVCPDLFVEWDHEVPMTDINPRLIDNKNRGKRAVTFSKHKVCDITIFGLRFHCDIDKLYGGDVEGAYTLYPEDRWGTYRVFQSESDGKYYIWVGDCPELWQKYQECKPDYNYQTKKTSWRPDSANVATEAPKVFSSDSTYTKGQTIALTKSYSTLYDTDGSTKWAQVMTNFTTGKNPNMGIWNSFVEWLVPSVDGYSNAEFKGLKELWKDAKDAGQITEIPVKISSTASYDAALYDIRDYEIYALREKDGTEGFEFIEEGNPSVEERGNIVVGRDHRGRQVKMTREYRIKTYLQSTFRSAMPLAYGEVKISDIVKQLAWLEKWDDNEIIDTTASSYKAGFYFMNGQTALEYISETLCPEATEAGGGRVGYTCFFDKNKFIFRPASMTYTGGTVYETGYNRKDSDVISFTVRSRGVLLMQGVDADIANVNAYTNENVAASTNKQDLATSSTEARLRQALELSEKGASVDPYDSFFNLPLYYYYGNRDTSISDYENFIRNLNNGAKIYNIPFIAANVITTTKSSSNDSTDVVHTALADLEKLKNTCIQAEMTIIGNTALSPGQWITVNNYTKRGPHYTSGDYFVQSITDQVTAGGAFTQNLSMYRFSENVTAMTTGNTHLETGISILQRYGQERFEKWILDNYPELAKDYNISADTLGQDIPNTDRLLSGNEGKPKYNKINGVEFWGDSKLIEDWSDAKNMRHYYTYFYADSNTYLTNVQQYSGTYTPAVEGPVPSSTTSVSSVGYINNYKAHTLPNGSYFDRYGNTVTPLN